MSMPRALILLCAALLATATCGATVPDAPNAPASAAVPGESQGEGGLLKAKEAAQAMERHAKAAAKRSKEVVGDLTLRTAWSLLRLADKADGAAQRAAYNWKAQLQAAKDEARDDIAHAEKKVQEAAQASAEALERAKEAAQASARRGKEQAEDAARAAREALARAEAAAIEGAQAAKDAVSEALSRSEKKD